MTLDAAAARAVGVQVSDRVTTPDPFAALTGLFAAGDALVLTGAGISTESGIPDYRGPTGARRRSDPITYQTFVADPRARQRYWARSHLGWRAIARAAPNAGHRAVARLQRAGLLTGLITQNVDGLHQAGGAFDVVELHGNLDRVICLRCGELSARDRLDALLREANPGWDAEIIGFNADGDVDLEDTAVADFHVVDCPVCGGVLKPDVIFFGESVPPARVATCYRLVERARALVVLGSSLTVMSGYRFVLAAAARAIPVAIVNQGPTRGDGHATVRLDLPLGAALPRLVARVRAQRGESR